MRATISLALTCTILASGCSCDASPPPADAGPIATIDAGAVARDALGAPLDGWSGPDASTETRLASGVTLDGLALFQGVRVELARAGAPLPSRNAPVVAARDAVVRAYVSASSYPRAIRGELEIREGARVVAVHSARATLTRASDDAAADSVLSFDVPAEEVTPTATLSVRLVDDAGAPATGAHPARLPRDGTSFALDARDDGEGLHLVLVPFRWDSDGSRRLPDTSEAWLARVRALLTSLYPIVDLRIDVHAAVPWSGGTTWSGSADFGEINSALMDLRLSERAPEGAYYYALVAPDVDLASYCGGSCVTGQSYVADDPSVGDFRVGSGVGFGTESSAWTLAHEVGHQHGRYHAPCDTSGADADYPYLGGEIGVLGYDPRTRTFHPPARTFDFMGYCDPQWISDYTWTAMFERTVAVSALSRPRRDALLVRVEGERARIVGRRAISTPRTRHVVPYAFHDARGRTLARGLAPAIVQSHSEEELVVLPAPPSGAVTLHVNGALTPLE